MSKDEEEDQDDEGSPGWEAIDRALEKIYGATEPLHYAPRVPASLGGKEPIDGISAYARPEMASRSDPTPHWHFVTYGLTELHAKESDDDEVSGLGFELTLRVARQKDDREPPAWALNFLQNLGRYCFDSGNGFGVGHKMNLNGPIARGTRTAIGAICFALDPELGEMDTPHGHVQFLQIVGLTVDEWETITEWNPLGMLDILKERSPLWVTDLDRASVLSDAGLAAKIQERVAAEGSSQGSAFAGSATWSVRKGKAKLTIGAGHVMSLPRLLRGRTAHGRDFELVGKKGSLTFEPSEEAGWSGTSSNLAVRVSSALREQMMKAIVPKRGKLTFAALPDFVLDVVPTEIKDQEGNVIETIG